jgi:alkylation response protein AidB-like acyl-CoA dehydrogenase
MDFRHTEEQQAWKDMLHGFMEKDVGREYTREHDESREFPEEAYKKIADHGWLGLLVPEADGGLEADPVFYAIFCEAMAKFSLDTAACVMTSMFTATNIVRHGTQEQKSEHLPVYLSGERKFSVSISEPEAGSDAAAVRSTAVLDGDEWVLNGNKIWCSGAHLPGAVITVLARTGEDRHKGLGTTEYFMTDVRVPKGNMLGEPGQGWEFINGHLEFERLGLASSYVGNARTALDDTIAYTKQRTQFGRSLSSFQVLKHRMAEDETRLQAARLLVFQAATKMARGEPAIQEVSMAKVFAADTAFQIAFNGMQALGGYSQLPEYDMERYFREAKHGMVGGGANEIQRTIIAREMGL